MTIVVERGEGKTYRAFIDGRPGTVEVADSYFKVIGKLVCVHGPMDKIFVHRSYGKLRYAMVKGLPETAQTGEDHNEAIGALVVWYGAQKLGIEVVDRTSRQPSSY